MGWIYAIVHVRNNNMASKPSHLVKRFPTAHLITRQSVDLWIRHIAKKGDLSASSVTRIIGSGKNFFKYLQFIKEVPATELNPFIIPPEFKISNKPNSKSINKTQSWLAIPITISFNLLINFEQKGIPVHLRIVNFWIKMINLKSDFVRFFGCHYFVVSEGIRALLWEARLLHLLNFYCSKKHPNCQYL